MYTCKGNLIPLLYSGEKKKKSEDLMTPKVSNDSQVQEL